MPRTQSHSRQKSMPSTSLQPSSPVTRGERRLINPFRCRVWTQHSRPEEQLTEAACKSLRESIDKNGQHQPALGRPINDDPSCDVEIICGARRHSAALALRQDLLIELRDLSDAEAYVAMYEENAERKDDCPYVQGQILRRALHSSAYSSQEGLARAFRLSHSKVQRLLMISQLPSIIISAFQSPNDIRESWGVALYQLWKASDPEHALTARARAIVHRPERMPARNVYAALTTANAAKPSNHRLHRSIPVYGRNHIILFREQEQVAHFTFTVPKTMLTQHRREALTQAMLKILDIETAPPAKNSNLSDVNARSIPTPSADNDLRTPASGLQPQH